MFKEDDVGKSCEPLGRYSLKWRDNIKVDVPEIGEKVVYWAHLVQYRYQ
jgi:hypothetical protein